MKKQITIFLSLLIITIGCNTLEYKPKYKVFTNAWERENLIGRVKKLEQYKANITDFESIKTGKSIISFRKKFTENGGISYQEKYNNFGELEQYTRNKYDKNGYQIESITENFTLPMKSVEKFIVDTIIGKLISVHGIFDDTLKMDAYLEYDEDRNIIRSTRIENGDTVIVLSEYEFDGNRNILFKKQIQNTEAERYEWINEYKYDKEGVLIESSNKSDFCGEMKSVYKYNKKKRLKKITEYESGQIEKETFYDNWYNKILIRFYVGKALNKEMQYKYKFDEKGNWIQRDVFIKENFGNKETTPISTETRKIEYYEEILEANH